MITLAVVLGTANIPAAGIALIFGLDRVLDMFRTSLNIVGDLTCTALRDGARTMPLTEMFPDVPADALEAARAAGGHPAEAPVGARRPSQMRRSWPAARSPGRKRTVSPSRSSG